MCFEVKRVTGPTIIEKAKSFYAEITITKKCMFPEGSDKKITCKNVVQCGC
jgi:hypothetical protein